MENLTKSQSLMQSVDYVKIIFEQKQNILDAGFVPVEVNVTRHVYEKMKSEFCSKNGISQDSIELKKFADLPIRVQNADSNFNNGSMGGFIFPIQVTMILPTEPACQENSEDEESQNQE